MKVSRSEYSSRFSGCSPKDSSQTSVNAKSRPTLFPRNVSIRSFQGVLTLLYRLLFLLYAEARDLLPVRETLEYSGVSITAIKREIGDAAGSLDDTVAGKLKKQYRLDSHALYGRMARLFGVVDRGDADLNVPAYNGGLFISKPRAGDESAEATAARFLADHKVPDLFLAQALDSLARDEDPKTHQLVPIDFKSLGVRQLGSIYEGLLEFRLRIAEEKKAIVKEKGREVFVSFKDLDERERERAESQERIVRKGDVYLENDKGERKATGSYYTPDHIVNYIVEHAVGPIVREKFETMRQRLREAERWHRDSVRRQKRKAKSPPSMRPDRPSTIAGAIWLTSSSTSRYSIPRWVPDTSWSRP